MTAQGLRTGHCIKVIQELFFPNKAILETGKQKGIAVIRCLSANERFHVFGLFVIGHQDGNKTIRGNQMFFFRRAVEAVLPNPR